jgi:membrane-associated phospholipid phosphatase
VDARLFKWINRLADHTAWAHPLAKGFAVYGIVLFAALLVIAYLDARHRGDLEDVAATVGAAGAALVALALAQVIGSVVDRARPYTAMPGVHVLIDRTSDFSFPSDHATAVGAVAAGLLLLHRRRWGVVAAVAAVVMGAARVYVGAHYPGDVVAGLALGAVVAVAVHVAVVPLLTRLAARLAHGPARPLVTAGAPAAPVPTAAGH